MNAQRVALGELIREADPGFASGKRSNDGVLQVRMNCVDSEGRLDLGVAPRVPAIPHLSRYLLESGDIVFNATNSPALVGKSALFRGNEEPVAFSNHFIRLRVRTDRLEPAYLVRWLLDQWKRRVFERMCTQWVNQASIPKDRLLQLRLPLPPIPEQRRIGAVLDKAVAVRQKRRDTLRLLDKLLRSAFLEVFGDPVRNEKGWNRVRASSVIRQIESGSSVKGQDRQPRPGDWAVLKISAVTSGWYLPSECKVVTAPPDRLVIPRRGDLLFSRANTRELVAATCLVDREEPGLFLPDKLWRITAHAEMATLEYLRFLLADPRFRATLTRYATGTSGSMLNVSQDKLLRLDLPLPPLVLQHQFASLVSRIYTMRERIGETSRQIDQLFDSLAQRAFGRDAPTRAALFLNEVADVWPEDQVRLLRAP